MIIISLFPWFCYLEIKVGGALFNYHFIITFVNYEKTKLLLYLIFFLHTVF